MPGIVGCITRLPRDWAEQKLRQMVEALRHESFYAVGTWAEESEGIYAGWVAPEGSAADGMPLRNERGDVLMVFSGEEFPEPDTAQRLKERGHELEGNGPSYLVHLYEEDLSFPAGLNGRFHGLLADQNRKTTVLFNDRYGMHRIYYHESEDAFYFAAEAKAILAVCPELRKMDLQGWGEFVACGAVLENRTLFAGIRVLPPASAWFFRHGSLERKTSYFHPKEWENQERLDPESSYKEIRQAFSRNLPRYFRGPQRIAMSMTGGLDTRMVVAWNKPKRHSLPFYTYGGMLRDCQDVIVAREISHFCQQPFEVIPAGEDFLVRFPHYAERAVYLTDGCVDVSRAPDLYLSERAREIAPVRMTGLFGGEVLRQVRSFKPQVSLPGLFAGELLGHVRRASETYASNLRGRAVSFAVFKQAPWHQFGGLALEQTQLSVRSPFLDNEFVRAVFRAPDSALANHKVSLRLIGDGNGALLQIPTDRGVGGNRGRFLGEVSRAFLEFLFKAEYGYDMGMPQWVARLDHFLSSLRLERLFLGRHKIFHFRIWYRDTLAGYVREILLDSRSLSRPYIDRKGIEAVVEGHLHGSRNYTGELHKLLTLELIHRVFLDNPGKPSPPPPSGVQTALNHAAAV